MDRIEQKEHTAEEDIINYVQESIIKLQGYLEIFKREDNRQ